MSDLAALPAFSALRPVGEGVGMRVRLIAPALASVLARRAKTDALIEKAQAAFGLGLIDGPRRVVAGQVCALGMGPGRWMFVGAEAEMLKSEFSGLASVSDHGDGYALFALSGPKVRDVLAKGVALDLDSFTPGDAALTSIAHIGAILWSEGDDQFTIGVFRSYAGSFWHWLAASAAEFGLVVEDKP